MVVGGTFIFALLPAKNVFVFPIPIQKRSLSASFFIFPSILYEHDGPHNLRRIGPIVAPCGGVCNLVYDVHTLYDTAKSGILAIQMRRILMHDEKLGARRIRVHAARHGDNTARVLDGIVKSIGGKFAPNAVSRAAHAGAVWASALDHKAGDDAVKGQAVIKFFADQLFKVFYSARRLVRFQL